MSKRSLLLVLVFLVLSSAMVFSKGQQEASVPVEPVEPKIFTYAVDYDPPSIDPQKNYAGFGELIASNINVGLVALDDKMNPIPGVAESWKISPDGLTYTFYMRKDSKWSDGTDLTAQDFYWSWIRLLQPETGSKYTNLAFPIVNAEQYTKGEVSAEDVGIKVIDDYTIEVSLIGPVPYMLQNFAHGAFMPMREDMITADPEGWAINPETNIGNGPFVLKSYGMNDRIVLERNPYYYDGANVHLDEIHLVTIPEGSTALAAYNAGEIDGFSFIPSTEVPRLMAETNDIYLNPRVRTLHMYINTEAPPMDNPKLREALSRAIDREELARVRGLGRLPATGYVPVGLSAEGEDFREVGGDLGISTTADVAAAKAALAEAGYANGGAVPAITVTMAADYRQTVETIQEMWKKNLGVEIEIETVEGRVLSNMRKSGEFQIAMGGWSANIFHPSYYINQIESTGPSNYSNYTNPAYDKLVAQARIEPDPKKVLDLLHEAEQLAIGQDFAIFPLYYETSMVMMKEYVKGWYSDPIGRFHFKNIDIQK